MFDIKRYIKQHTEFALSWTDHQLKEAIAAERQIAVDPQYCSRTRHRANVLVRAYEALLQRRANQCS